MVDQAEIHRKVVSGGVIERRGAVEQLYRNFAVFRDRKQAWEDLIRLTQDEDWSVRWRAVDAIGDAFPHVHDRKQAWENLIRLTQDEERTVRWRAAYAVGVAFQHIPNRKQAWKCLHRLTQDEESYVRRHAAYALGVAFLYILNKKQAWEDLIRLTQDEESYVRWGAADAIGAAFPHIPDRKQAWKCLHRLTQDEESYVQRSAAVAIGNVFSHIPDRKQAWERLIQMTQDKDSDVQVSANHSLGGVCIFEATETESKEDFREKVENALEFFEESSTKATHFSNPSKFCLPFYKSFHAITFEKVVAEAEVQKYLIDAKSASEGSENKETLLEAIENLANALSEAYKTREMGFDAIKSDFNAYMQYCNHAADRISAAGEKAPIAAKLITKGLPIINDRIKELIPEIQEKAGAVCRETRGTGTPYEPLGMEVNKWAGELSDRDYLRNEKNVSRIINSLGEFCNLLPEDKREYPCKIVEEIREESELEDKLSGIPIVLSYLLPSIKSEIQNAAKPMTDKTRSDKQPSQKTSRGTTVFASDSTVVVTETKSGEVTVNTAVTKESQSDKQPDRSSKRTVVEISADIAVHVLVYTVLHHFAEDLMPVIAPILVLSALIILLLIIRNAKSR